jgi:hypothetical protein
VQVGKWTTTTAPKNWANSCRILKKVFFSEIILAVLLCLLGTDKAVPVLLTEHHAMGAYWGNGSVASLIL